MKVEGVDRLKRKLARLPKVAREDIKAALAASADEIVAAMRNLVPVDRGDLKASIGWTFGAAPKGSSVLTSSNRAVSQAAGLVATIYVGGGDAFHARWVEFGTVIMRAQPFFFPAYRFGRKRAKARIARAANKAAKKVAAG